MGKCIASGRMHVEITVCASCFHRNVCGEKDYLAENECCNFADENRLREQAEREKGCCHCKGITPLQQGIGCAPYASSAHIAKDGVMWCGNEAIRINYCPMCGRKLEVEE